MALKYKKTKVDQYTFTGKDFAQAMYDADVTPYKIDLATRGHVYHNKIAKWIQMDLVTVDKFTFKKIMAVLGGEAR